MRFLPRRSRQQRHHNSDGVSVLVTQQMVELLAVHMKTEGITQAELSRRTGRTTKHINQVFGGKAGTSELDYWAFVLGFKFEVALVPLSSTPGLTTE